MLNKHSAPSFGLAHISLTLVGLMWVLPFLYYHHAYPITTFYQEWIAGLLGLGAMSLLVTGGFWQEPQVPRMVMLPIGMMLLMMIQFLMQRLTHLDHVLLLAQYFLYAALLIMLGQRLRIELGLPLTATVLAVFLLVGAELNTLAGILQHFRWNTFLNPVITMKTSVAVYGNTAQPNHYADYLALGMISLGLLYMRLSMRAWQVALLATPMLFVMVLSGSRSAWLFLMFAVALAFVWQRKSSSLRPLLYYSLALLAGFAAMHLLVQMSWLQGSTGSVTSAERLLEESASGSIRLHLWREAALIFAQYPLMGAGFGQFAWEHLQLAAELRNVSIVGLYNNAHNIVMQIAAEGGVSGLVVLFGSAAIWLWQTRKAERDIYHWWGYAALAVMAIHSLLEYPLWYLYFLGVASVLLGMFDTKAYRLELRKLGRISVAVMLLLGALSLAQLFQGYGRLERILSLRGKASTDRSLIPRVQEEMLAVYQYPLLSSYGELFIASTMEVGTDHLEQKLSLNERALRFIPIAPLAYHQAWLLALSGRPDEAKQQLERAIWAYPDGYANARKELEGYASKDHARFAPLIEFATHTYEEYRSAAVPAK